MQCFIYKTSNTEVLVLQFCDNALALPAQARCPTSEWGKVTDKHYKIILTTHDFSKLFHGEKCGIMICTQTLPGCDRVTYNLPWVSAWCMMESENGLSMLMSRPLVTQYLGALPCTQVTWPGAAEGTNTNWRFSLPLWVAIKRETLADTKWTPPFFIRSITYFRPCWSAAWNEEQKEIAQFLSFSPLNANPDLGMRLQQSPETNEAEYCKIDPFNPEYKVSVCVFYIFTRYLCVNPFHLFEYPGKIKCWVYDTNVYRSE